MSVWMWIVSGESFIVTLGAHSKPLLSVVRDPAVIHSHWADSFAWFHSSIVPDLFFSLFFLAPPTCFPSTHTHNTRTCTHTHTRTYPAATCCFGNRVEMRREQQDKNGSVAWGWKIPVVWKCKDEEGMNGGTGRTPERGKKGDRWAEDKG